MTIGISRTTRPPAVLVVAHGSRDPRHAASIERFADALRDTGTGGSGTGGSGTGPVAVGYLDHCGPSVTEALRALATTSDQVVALPLFLAAAYHVKHDVPGALDRARAALRPALRHRVVVRVADALGPNALLIAAMEGRLRQAGVWPGDDETAVVLGAAGTSDPGALAGIMCAAWDWARLGWHAVMPAYASTSAPTADAAVRELRRTGARRVVVASYFLAPGNLSDRLADAARAAGADAVTAPLCTPREVAPDLVRLAHRRYHQAANLTCALSA
jgi:sirohydrochlorin ferrochelatase